MPSERLSGLATAKFAIEPSLPCSTPKSDRNRAEFSGRCRLIIGHVLVLGPSGHGWPCWQPAANPSLPANLGNARRIRQKAGKAPNCPCRTSQHLNDLDGFLPALTSRENLVRRRDAGDISFRNSGTSALPLKADMPSVLTYVRFGSEVDDGHAGYLIRTHKSWAAHDCSLALHCAMHQMDGVIDADSTMV